MRSDPEDSTEDLENRERENQSERMFREQFALNRPRFWNTGPGLEPKERGARGSIEGRPWAA